MGTRSLFAVIHFKNSKILESHYLSFFAIWVVRSFRYLRTPPFFLLESEYRELEGHSSGHFHNNYFGNQSTLIGHIESSMSGYYEPFRESRYCQYNIKSPKACDVSQLSKMMILLFCCCYTLKSSVDSRDDSPYIAALKPSSLLLIP